MQMERLLDPDAAPTLAKSARKVATTLTLSPHASPRTGAPAGADAPPTAALESGAEANSGSNVTAVLGSGDADVDGAGC